MLKSKLTLAIYCIPDKNNWDFADISHDHNLSLWNAGKIEKYLHLERFTRKKYDNSLHVSLYKILKQLKIFNKKLDIVFVDNVLGRSCISQDGKFRFEAFFNKKLNPGLEKAYSLFLETNPETFVLNHELAHIYSTVPFFGMFKDYSLLLHFDGGASLGDFSVWLFKNNRLQLIDYGWKWKYLSNLFNANALNFFILGIKRPQHNSFPGKFMGYTAYGKPDKKILYWLKQNNFFADIWNNKKIFFKKAYEEFGWKNNVFNTKDKFLQDIAATVQDFFSQELLVHLKKLQAETGAEYLYYSGGSALNIVTNTKIVESKIFKDVFIPPVANDSGLSVGAGAFLQMEKGFEIEKHSPFLNNFGLDCQSVSENYDFSLIEKVAKLLLEEKVIGIHRDCGEAGPRALGNRSIIALPHSLALAKKVSQKIKGREWYRPVAPIMLEKNAKYFTGLEQIHHLSRFMLLNFRIKQDKNKEIKGTVHVDGTARIQTVFSREQHPFFFDLLTYLDKNYSIKALINTSFNGKGEPMTHTPEDAINTARSTGLDALVLQDEVIIL